MYINEASISDIVHENLDFYQETESKTAEKAETAETAEGEEDEIDFLDGEIIIPEDVDPSLNAFKVGLGKTHIKNSGFCSGRTTKVLPSLH